MYASYVSVCVKVYKKFLCVSVYTVAGNPNKYELVSFRHDWTRILVYVLVRNVCVYDVVLVNHVE